MNRVQLLGAFASVVLVLCDGYQDGRRQPPHGRRPPPGYFPDQDRPRHLQQREDDPRDPDRRNTFPAEWYHIVYKCKNHTVTDAACRTLTLPPPPSTLIPNLRCYVCEDCSKVEEVMVYSCLRSRTCFTYVYKYNPFKMMGGPVRGCGPCPVSHFKNCTECSKNRCNKGPRARAPLAPAPALALALLHCFNK